MNKSAGGYTDHVGTGAVHAAPTWIQCGDGVPTSAGLGRKNAEKTMSIETHVSQPLYGLHHTGVEDFDSLPERALDMRSSWNHATDQDWRQLVGAIDGNAYRAQVSATRPATDYTARVILHRDGVAVPLEAAQILWQ